MKDDLNEICEVKLKTLSEVHIGNGETLLNGIDFIMKTNPKERGFVGYVLDYDKIGNEISKDRESLNKWIKALIDNDKNFLKVFISSYIKRENCKRIIPIYCDKDIISIKEYIHNGEGLPYLPGSSIKGAIRTAIISKLIDKNLLNEIRNNYIHSNGNIGYYESNIKKSINKWDKQVFGDIEQNMMKNIHISDAYFKSGEEIVRNNLLINQNKFNVFLDKSKKQAMEVIAKDKNSSFRIKLIRKFSKDEKSNEFRQRMDEEGLPYLFNIINDYSKSLIKQEINYWECRDSEIADYIVNLQNISDEIENCIKGKECILRIGEGSGWKFITGAWTERLGGKIFYEMIVPLCRNQHKYGDFVFPKSRTVTENIGLLGFIKLSIE